MRKFYILSISFFILTSLFLGSCILSDYFSGYTGKNLAEHVLLSEWNTSHSTPYMDYAVVSSSIAGTTGLPDTSALIYRLENENLFPDGDFEASTAGSPPNANWTGTGGTYTIRNTGHVLNGNALEFDQSNNEFISFELNNLTDSAYPYNNYVIRFSLDANNTGDYLFVVDDISGTSSVPFVANIEATSTFLRVPEDINNFPQTEFEIHSGDNEVFRINRSDSEYFQHGFIDNIRVVKSDQKQELSVFLPYEDVDRIDNLDLISGWYRFGLFVKADPEAGSGNRFNACAVTIGIESIDEDNLGGSSNTECFYSADYSSFSEWTFIYIDAELQITSPSNSTNSVIRLSVSPCCTVGGALGADAGSILISTPSLKFSPTSTF